MKIKKSVVTIVMALSMFTTQSQAQNNFFQQMLQEIIDIINASEYQVPTMNTFAQLPEPLTDADFHLYSDEKVQLGNILFYDKILSGNMNDSCATCHHGMAATGDGLSLSIGEGGSGLGVSRDTGYENDAVHERVPRNAPHVFNAGAKEMTVMFHDGRVFADASQPSGFSSPAGADLPMGLDNTLAAQAMFPVTSGTEMAGQAGENEVADQAAVGRLAGVGGVWDLLSKRIQNIPEYVTLFQAAFEDVNQASDITYVHIANALAAFEAVVWRADNSPFDQYLRGDKGAMSPNQIAGMNLFYGDAGCADCHSGKLLGPADSFKSIGMIQFGPGKGDNLDGYNDGQDDFGRERVTGDVADRFKFRVLSARNVLLTGPWGHTGAYDNLEDLIKHHLDPVEATLNYDRSQAKLPIRDDLDAIDFTVLDDDNRTAQILASSELTPRNLNATQIARLIDFLDAATDRRSVNLRNEVPRRVPSGLPVFD
ncbi:cytochrome-c peroxidase [Marinicella litoralis]|uniref:Cytochrome c peroxidase n=1 Tax=Marinicella litoralis TaxID=644220 RepID=A0A4R6XQX8_9GAMM|nr:cytochrome c peroxidase [Marinicella litoralis]TDR20384.1 cytochrome c peroxidase [Marinicella litoralis]